MPFPIPARVVWPVCALLMTLSSARAQSQDTTELRLEALIAEALAANPALRAATLDAEALAQRPDQLAELPDPTLAIGYRPFAIGTPTGLVPAQVLVQQLVPYPGKRALEREVAEKAAETARWTVEEERLELLLQVRTTYYDLWRVQERERLIARFQSQLEDFELAAARQYEVGTGLQQAILKAQVEKTTLARQRLDLSAARRAHLERLARLTHQPRLARRATRVGPPSAIQEVPASLPATSVRPEVRALEAGVQMTEAEIARARRAYRPDFIVGAGLMDMMMPGDVAPLDNLGSRFGIEFGLSLPLRRAGRNAALAEARTRHASYEARLEAAQTRIQTELEDLRYRLVAQREALDLYQTTLIPQAEMTLEATRSAYTTGRTGFLDLLDAQRMLFELHMAEIDTQADLLQTEALLDRTIGTRYDPLSNNAGAATPARDR